MQSIKRITANDIAYVIGTRGDRCVRWFQTSTPSWAQALVPQLKLLLAMLRDSMSGQFQLSWADMSAITATLLYIGNPFDVLPNSLPEVGHLDDALVVALCVSTVRKDLRRYALARGAQLGDVEILVTPESSGSSS
ncbi:MAG: DUF1232 domain-containing protein [bacterium]|nr:DUF1232 domain-containing protein [bacterium]